MLLNELKKIFFWPIITILFLFVSCYTSNINIAYAFDTSSANYLNGYYNHLIDDADFINKNGMTVEEIQTFLTTKGSYLASYTAGDGRTAAQIIWDASQGNTVDSRSNGWKPCDFHGTYSDGSCRGQRVANFPDIDQSTGTVSPKVILVNLDKEQSLITGKFRLDGQGDFSDTEWINYALLHAMGYACPDEGTWDPAMFGFAKQIDWGAWQLRFSFDRAQGYGFTDFQNGQTMNFADYYQSANNHNVTFAGSATASLFRYTPYLFNGNYNFWKFYTGWFSDPTYAPPVDPTPNTPPPPPPRKMGDGNGDNTVDSTDLSILADQWGKSVTADSGADFNKDGIVDSTDLSILADAWGK